MAAIEQHHPPAQQPGARHLILTLIELINTVINQGFKFRMAELRFAAELVNKITAQRADNTPAFTFVRTWPQHLKGNTRQHYANNSANPVINKCAIVIAWRIRDR